MQGTHHVAHWRFNAVHARRDFALVSQRRHQADGAMTTHVQITRVIEENHPSRGLWIHRFTQQRAHQHIVATRLQNHATAIMVVLVFQNIQALGHAACAQIGKACIHHARWLAACVGIDNVNFLVAFRHGVVLSKR